MRTISINDISTTMDQTIASPNLGNCGDHSTNEDVIKLNLGFKFRSQFELLIKGETSIDIVKNNMLKIATNAMIKYGNYYVIDGADTKDGIIYISTNPDDEFPWSLWFKDSPEVILQEILEKFISNYIAGQLVGTTSIQLQEVHYYNQLFDWFKDELQSMQDLHQTCIDGIKHDISQVISQVLFNESIIVDCRNKEPNYAVAFAYFRRLVKFSKGAFKDIKFFGDIIPKIKQTVKQCQLIEQTNIGRCLIDITKLNSNSTAVSVSRNYYEDVIAKMESNAPILTHGYGLATQFLNNYRHLIFYDKSRIAKRIQNETEMSIGKAYIATLKDPEFVTKLDKFRKHWIGLCKSITTHEEALDFLIKINQINKNRPKGIPSIDILDMCIQYLNQDLVDKLVKHLRSIKLDPTITSFGEPLDIKYISLPIVNTSKLKTTFDSSKGYGKQYVLQIGRIKIWESEVGRVLRFAKFIKLTDQLPKDKPTILDLRINKSNTNKPVGITITYDPKNQSIEVVSSFLTHSGKITEFREVIESNILTQLV